MIRLVFSSAFLLLAIPSMANAQISFNFNYTDAAGVGFNDSTFGQDRKNALTLAGQNFSRAFSSYNAVIDLDVGGGDTGSTLMSAGSNFDNTRSVGFGNDEVVRSKILFGSDLNGSAADGVVNVNFSSVTWELDIAATPMGSEFDWYSTAYHEFAHALGFSSAINTDGTVGGTNDGFAGYDANSDGSWGKFDEFLTDVNGNSVFTGNNLDEAMYTSLLIGGASPAGGLFFESPSGGERYGLYTPTTLSLGSSGSHLDDENSALGGFMMLANTGPGPSQRLFNPIEQNIFRDIGYTNVGQISAVPEPGSLAVLGLFFGAVALRRRRSV